MRKQSVSCGAENSFDELLDALEFVSFDETDYFITLEPAMDDFLCF